MKVFIAGPITGIPRYWEAFEAADDNITGMGHIALNPARLPQGMTYNEYERICLAMIDVADAVLFLPGWSHSRGASFEHEYCGLVGKARLHSIKELEGTNERKTEKG